MIIIIDILIIVVYLIYNLFIKDLSLKSFEGIVTSIEKGEKKNKIEVTNFFQKIIAYDYSFINIEIGDKVTINGQNIALSKNHNEYAFNYQRYLLSKRIVSIIDINTIDVNKSINIYSLKRYLYKYIDYFFQGILSEAYIKGFLFGDTSLLSDEISESIQINSISHLFAISGLHISIIISILEKILSQVIKNEEKRENIICVFIGFYLLVNYFAVSISRAIVMYYLKILNKRKKLKLSSLDIISITFTLFLLFNPLIFYSISFQLSFLASFAIILYSESIKLIPKTGLLANNIINNLVMTIYVQIMTLPITINMNNSFNLLSPFVNIIFIAIVSYIILPMSFLTFFMPILKYFYEYILKTFEYLNVTFAKLSLNIVLPSMTIIGGILFYVLLYLLINNYKNLKIYVICLISCLIYYNKANLNIIGKVSFLALPEGDAIVIDLPLNKGIVLIDTGVSWTDDVIDYLKASGIRKIDYLVLTHNHDDHNGKASVVLSDFNVTKIIVSEYDNSRYSQTNKTVIVKGGDKFVLNGYEFNILAPNENKNTNDNGIVIYTKLGNLKYLFLADVGKEVEETLFVEEVDIVKVGHHGSSTSTSSAFYKKIDPQYAIITSGYNNKYGFPHEETLETLQNKKIYRTDKDNQINVLFTSIGSIIKTIG